MLLDGVQKGPIGKLKQETWAMFSEEAADLNFTACVSLRELDFTPRGREDITAVYAGTGLSKEELLR